MLEVDSLAHIKTIYIYLGKGDCPQVASVCTTSRMAHPPENGLGTSEIGIGSHHLRRRRCICPGLSPPSGHMEDFTCFTESRQRED